MSTIIGEAYVGDTGTQIRLDCGEDITDATGVTIEAKKPGGATVSWTGSVSGTNHVAFETLAGSLDTVGRWVLQAKVTTPDGVWRGRAVEMLVRALWD